MQNSNYNHLTIEKEIYAYWEKNKFNKLTGNEVNFVNKKTG